MGDEAQINKSVDWTPSVPMNTGDVFTVQGRYKRRSFWQWFRNEPRELQQYKIVAANESYSQYDPTR